MASFILVIPFLIQTKSTEEIRERTYLQTLL